MKEQEVRFMIPRDVGNGIMETIYPYDTWFQPRVKYKYAKKWGSYPVKEPPGAYVVEEMDIETGQMVKKLYTNVPDDVMAVLFQTDRKEAKAQRDQEEHMFWGAQTSENDENGDWHFGAMDIAAYEQYTHEENQPEGEKEFPDDQLCGRLSDNPIIRNAQVRYMCEIVRKVLPYLTKKNYQTFYQLFHQCLREVDIARAEKVAKSAVTNRKNRLIDQIVPVFESLGFVIPTKAEMKAERKAAEERNKRLDSEMREAQAEERAIILARRLTDLFYNEGMLDEETKSEIDDELENAA